jgi:hypothetical protein
MPKSRVNEKARKSKKKPMPGLEPGTLGSHGSDFMSNFVLKVHSDNHYATPAVFSLFCKAIYTTNSRLSIHVQKRRVSSLSASVDRASLLLKAISRRHDRHGRHVIEYHPI